MFHSSLAPVAKRFAAQDHGARLLLKEVPDPHRFGVATIEGDKVTKIVEKPKDPESSMAVTGIYFYDNTAFTMIKELSPSDRGELEITDVNNLYLAKDALEYDMLEGYWTDAGTFESYKRANELAFGDESGGA